MSEVGASAHPTTDAGPEFDASLLRPCRGALPHNPAGMAVFGTLSTVRAQLAGAPRFKAAFDYLVEALQPGSAAHQRIGKVAVGATDRIELDGGSFALE